MNLNLLKHCVLFLLLCGGVNAQSFKKPNIILILSDDVGFPVLTVNGGHGFSTPNIDSMARHGMNFTHCESTPLCAPSRMMLLTGKYNFRNYSDWGFMNETEKTFGNLMQEAGYVTGFFGKLQLQYSYNTIHNWGWSHHSVFDLTGDTVQFRRYKNPVLVRDGYRIPDSVTENKYGDDVITDHIFNFIDSAKAKPFFIYYSMSLAHEPFSPTPDDSTFNTWDATKNTSDASYFPSMISYMDKEVGRILDTLKSRGLDKNTIVLFCGDNGTDNHINNGGDGQDGEKGSSTEDGTHVPLIVYWPGHITAGSKNDDLIDFSDFFPTLASAGGITNLDKYGMLDGVSFYNRMLGKYDTSKSQLFMHYQPRPNFSLDPLKRWVRDKSYKLYGTTGDFRSGNFYNIIIDPKEMHPIKEDNLTGEERTIKQKFQLILDTTGTWPEAPDIVNPAATNISSHTAILSADIKSQGASELVERGSTLILDGANKSATLNNGRITDDTVSLGGFSMLRTKLQPQAKYQYSLYAINNNSANNTNYARASFYTLSTPPLNQPDSLQLTIKNCNAILKWSGVQFPVTGASVAGYLVLYSTKTPLVIGKPNGHSPKEIISEGTLINLTSPLPTEPANSVSIHGLSPEIAYNFLVIPYTWNGQNDSTYNYLTQGALTATQNIHFGLGASVKNPSCFGSTNGSITANMPDSLSPVAYSLNENAFDTVSTFYNIGAGTYKLSAKDASGCIDSITVVVQQPSQLILSYNKTDVSCNGNNDGSVSLKAKGGTPLYFYSISKGNFDTGSYFNNLKAGNYTAIVKDLSNCKDTASITLSQSLNSCITYKFTVEPNPSSNDFGLYLSEEDANNLSSINIYNSYGELIEQIKSANNSVYRFGKTFLPGTYVVHVILKKSIKNFKIIKR